MAELVQRTRRPPGYMPLFLCAAGLLQLSLCSASGGMQVIGAGAGRTGTMSLEAAFEILGYNSYHMKEVVDSMFSSVPHSSFWHDLYAGKKSIAQVAAILDDLGYNASADDPVQAWTLELIDIYPEAKVVLTTRETTGKWVKSVTTLGSVLCPVFDGIPYRWVGSIATVLRFWKIFHGLRGYDFCAVDPKAAADWYDVWNAKIRAKVPKDRLLDFQVKEGWEPLCKFLGKPVPNVPFPNVNDSKSLSNLGLVATIVGYVLVLSPFVLLLTCCWCCNGRQKVKAKTN